MDLKNWSSTLVGAGFSKPDADSYGAILAKADMALSTLSLCTTDMLKGLGVESLGHQLRILQLASKEDSKPAIAVKLPPAKAPTLNMDMTPQAFRKFHTDWRVFCDLTSLPDNQKHSVLYSNAEEAVQTALLAQYPNFFDIELKDLLSEIEKVVTQRANPMIHRVAFANLSQGDSESIQGFVIRLRSSAKDCEFSCPKCKADISDTYIQDQFICGVNNDLLQTDILAKAETLENLAAVIKHSESFESALRDQGKLADSAEVAAARLSTYRSMKATSVKQRQMGAPAHNPNPPGRKCVGCGESHSKPGNRQEVCPAWGKRCHKCNGLNHISRACMRGKQQGSRDTAYFIDEHTGDESPMGALIANIEFSDTGVISEQKDTTIRLINVQVVPFSPIPETRDPRNIPSQRATTISVFPDSGASICLGGPSHLSQMGLENRHLIPCDKMVTAVGNHKMRCVGWIPVTFVVFGKETKQALYICDKISRLYFSQSACKAVGILPVDFPLPGSFMYSLDIPCVDSRDVNNRVDVDDSIDVDNHVSSHIDNTVDVKVADRADSNMPGHDSCNVDAFVPLPRPRDPPLPFPRPPSPPPRPTNLPFPATPENIPKLKSWLTDAFKDTAFSKVGEDGKFPALTGPLAHIHLKEGAVPRARHTPIPVPYHLRDATKESIDADVAKGILAPVPIGTPTEWCSRMVVQSKKDGRPRRTVDYVYLNSQCSRETHHHGSPFHLAMQVPAGAYKSILDAVDGYHSVPLDEESQLLTVFITEWGRYMYKRMPQGYVAAGDAYTSRYDAIIAEVKRKVKIVDDTLLWDLDIEEAFFHVFDYLTLCYMNGVVFNLSKFVFCEKETEYAGLALTEHGVAPSESMLKAIVDFPTPTCLTDARSWFGLVNQVAWAYSLGPIMQPFRDLIKSKSPFVWDETLQAAMDHSKQVIIDLVREGVSTFDVNRITCLAPDWSKDGMGFLLLQKYCPCPLPKAPVCCPEGWHLVFAGSRFCNDAESRYAPIEGEAAGIVWALNKCRMFVTGCPNLIVATDHAPLLGILGDRELDKITNPRLFKLKEKTLPYRFTIQHCPGKWHRGSDAMSRNAIAAVKAIFETCRLQPSDEDRVMSIEVETCHDHASVEAISAYGDDSGLLSPDMVRAAGRGDAAYTMLNTQIVEGFPDHRSQVDPLIRSYWEVRSRLSANNGLVMLDRRIVIPTGLRKRVLRNLHSAHQGVVGMKARANETVYWPGMDASIRNHRESCHTCVKVAPSQPREPLILTETPDWPFQMIVMDLFYVEQHTYLICADRFTGWPILYHFPPGKANATSLISVSRNIFHTYGVPEHLSTDGGPPFKAQRVVEFMKDWGVDVRYSSVGYAQSNGRAELGVKAAKRIVYENTAPDGSLDTNRATRAILQYRNTPIQGIGMSPAQLLLHRQLRDCVPAHPSLYKPHKDWVTAAYQREALLAKRNKKLIERYNQGTRPLTPLLARERVAVQDQKSKRWTRTGSIVEVLPHRQYRVRMDGSGRVTLRNRRFLKTTKLSAQGSIIPSPAMPPPVTPAPMPDATAPPTPGAPSPPNPPTPTPPMPNLATTPTPPLPARSNRILNRLADHNRPGAHELIPLSRRRGERK